MCSWCGNDAVEQNLGNEHVGCGSGNFARVVDAVTTHNEAGAIGFVLFGSDDADKLTICDVTEAVSWDVFFANKKDGVSAFYPPANAIGESTKLIGGGLGPICVVIGMA